MATDNYIAWPKRDIPGGDLLLNDVVVGASASAASFFEVRWQSDTGSGATGVKRKDLILFLDAMKRFVVNGGKLHDGTGVPPPG